MKKYFKYIMILTIGLFVFNGINVKALSCTTDTTCETTCQYITSDGEHRLVMFSYEGTTGGMLFEVVKFYKTNGNGGNVNADKDYKEAKHTGLKPLANIMPRRFTPGMVINSDTWENCPTYAYTPKGIATFSASGDTSWYCFDNDGKGCEKILKRGKKLLQYEKDTKSYNINGNGTVAKDANGKMTKETTEEFIGDDYFKKRILKANEEYDSCEKMLSEDGTKFLRRLLTFIQYGGVVLALLTSTLDFIKAVSSGSQDDLKKSSSKFLKRMIFAALLFFVVLLTNILLQFFDITVPTDCYK